MKKSNNNLFSQIFTTLRTYRVYAGSERYIQIVNKNKHVYDKLIKLIKIKKIKKISTLLLYKAIRKIKTKIRQIHSDLIYIAILLNIKGYMNWACGFLAALLRWWCGDFSASPAEIVTDAIPAEIVTDASPAVIVRTFSDIFQEWFSWVKGETKLDILEAQSLDREFSEELRKAVIKNFDAEAVVSAFRHVESEFPEAMAVVIHEQGIAAGAPCYDFIIQKAEDAKNEIGNHIGQSDKPNLTAYMYMEKAIKHYQYEKSEFMAKKFGYPTLMEESAERLSNKWREYSQIIENNKKK